MDKDWLKERFLSVSIVKMGSFSDCPGSMTEEIFDENNAYAYEMEFHRVYANKKNGDRYIVCDTYGCETALMLAGMLENVLKYHILKRG